jgi:hypothetical protein
LESQFIAAIVEAVEVTGSVREGCQMAVKELKATGNALTEAQAAHSRWAIWISSAGRYWATRRGKIQIPEKAHFSWAMTLDADSLEQLEKLINEQEEHER